MMIGTRLGPYEITAKLGEGGMGEVWRGTDTRLKREVAIKVLPSAFTEDHERLARFEREAQLLAQLHHPHIASIFGLEESGGVRALVMELVEGPTLQEKLGKESLPVDEAITIAGPVLPPAAEGEGMTTADGAQAPIVVAGAGAANEGEGAGASESIEELLRRTGGAPTWASAGTGLPRTTSSASVAGRPRNFA